MQIARFEKRVFAYLIDLILCLGIGIGIYFGCGLSHILSISWSVIVIFVIGGLIYVILALPFVLCSNGRTFGALLLGLKAVRIREGHIGFRSALIRTLGISLIGMVLINAIYMLIVHTNRTIFDQLSGTYVIDLRNRDFK